MNASTLICAVRSSISVANWRRTVGVCSGPTCESMEWQCCVDGFAITGVEPTVRLRRPASTLRMAVVS